MLALRRKNDGLLNPWNDFLGDFGLLNRMDEVFGELEKSDPVFKARTAVMEDKDAYHITTELPGIDKKDVKVELYEGILSITAERAKPESAEDEKEHFNEMRYGKFVNRLSIPENVEGEKIKAVFKNGLLTVTVPKVEVVKPKSIKISVSG